MGLVPESQEYLTEPDLVFLERELPELAIGESKEDSAFGLLARERVPVTVLVRHQYGCI